MTNGCIHKNHTWHSWYKKSYTLHPNPDHIFNGYVCNDCGKHFDDDPYDNPHWKLAQMSIKLGNTEHWDWKKKAILNKEIDDISLNMKD